MEQIDYKKKYEEAIARMNKWVEDSDIVDPKEVAEFVFPELEESEDEKLRKECISIIDAWDKSCRLQGDYCEVAPKCIAWLEKQGEPQDKGEISDGYHTFNELYYYRMLYNAAFFNMLPKEWVHKSKKHNDDEKCFGGGWFIVMANLPTGQISNHYELKYWDLFQLPEKEIADEWDGHTPQEAADRLHKYLLEKQGEQKPTNNDIKEALRTEYEKGRADAIAEIQKSAWSEEDDNMWSQVINEIEAIKSNSSTIFEKNIAQEKIDWLKSLKERIKGE